MSWYVHPSKQLRDDELPPELVVTNRDGSVEQVYVPYNATGEQLKAENAKLRELVRGLLTGYECGRGELCEECTWDGLGDPHTFACPVRVRARELGVEVDDGVS